MTPFKTKVRALMKARRLSQAAMAQSLGVQQPMISRWLANDSPPADRGRILALAKLLGVSVDYLLDDSLDSPKDADLTLDQKTILDVIKALGLPRDEVLRRLYGPPRYGTNDSPDPNQGQARLLTGQHDTPGHG